MVLDDKSLARVHGPFAFAANRSASVSGVVVPDASMMDGAYAQVQAFERSKRLFDIFQKLVSTHDIGRGNHLCAQPVNGYIVSDEGLTSECPPDMIRHVSNNRKAIE